LSKTTLKVCIFIIIRLRTSSSRNYTQVSTCLIPGNGWKRPNALVHFHHGPQRADAFEWIYLCHGFKYHISLSPVDSMHIFIVHKCVYALWPLNRRY